MPTRVLLTVDTELTWRHYVPGADWRTNFERSVEPAGVGIAYQLEQLSRHGLKAVFFVDPMPALVYGIEPIRAMVAPILAAGQEVQLHLHSFWSDLDKFPDREPRFEMTAFDGTGQQDLIAAARALLIDAGAPAPIAFRAGSYAADRHTLRAVRQNGIAFDSSHNGAERPWPSALPFPPETIDPVRHEGVTEIPVSLIRNRKGALRPLQICALSADEMQSALRHAADDDHAVVTIVSHSFELATRDGLRVNRVVRGRFDRLCAFLAAHRAVMPTIGFADAPSRAPEQPSEPMPACPARAARRAVEQLWGDARYERPGLTASALGGTSIAALEILTAYGGL